MLQLKGVGLNSPITLLFVIWSMFSSTFATVTLTTNGLTATVQNNFAHIEFKANSMVSKVTINGQNIAATGANTFYLDWNNNGQGYFTPTQLIVVQNTGSLAHFYWLQESNSATGVFRIELHYAMTDDVSGIYSWAKYTNDQTFNLSLGETRTVYRFNPAIFTQGTNSARSGTLYLYSYLNEQTKIQDETWQLPDGTYYTKYDYAGYIRETPYQGVYGNGFGAFVVSGSREYHGGGPLKQDLLIHQDSLIANYFVSGHFGTPGVSAPPGWSHIYGPWLVYFNTGSDSEILADVQNRVVTEQNSWPKSFVGDSDYPTSRGYVTGTVSGQKSATIALYDSVNEQFDIQQLGYLYTVNTDSKGYFSFSNVRPGTYKIVAYPLAGQGSENLAEDTVTVIAGTRQHVYFTLTEPSNILWSLGEANRRASEFKYADQLRNYLYETLPPDTNTFIIGQSDPKNDWYYGQTKPGKWYIQYEDTADGTSRTLRVAVAAASQSPHLIVYVNNHKVGDIYFSNDQSVYRSALQSGNFYSEVLTVNAAQVVTGTNTLTLQISKGQVMYDAISLQKN